MEIFDGSILYLRKYLLLSVRGVKDISGYVDPHSHLYEVRRECALEVMLVAWRLNVITSSTYWRLRRYLDAVDRGRYGENIRVVTHGR